MNWITEQAAGYETAVNLICDRSADGSDSTLTRSYLVQSAMRIEYAAQLLARGASPGEVAAQMGYCSGAYFSQKFRAATGHTPSAYRRIQQGLPARRQNRQQKGKSESKTPIAETPQKE